MGLREWFSKLNPLQQDIFLAAIAGAIGVVATYYIAKWLRGGG